MPPLATHNIQVASMPPSNISNSQGTSQPTLETSEMQKCTDVTMSTMEGEYNALSTITRDVLPLQQLLSIAIVQTSGLLGIGSLTEFRVGISKENGKAMEF
jgi:hypothetical protein